jgi:hypothetical protein
MSFANTLAGSIHISTEAAISFFSFMFVTL